MNHIISKHILPLVIISIITSLDATEVGSLVNSSCFFPRGHVYLVDKLPPDLPRLDLHCKSKDDDLGNHTLGIDQMFDFTFCENPVSTVFYCQFWWNGKTVGFDVYDYSWSKHFCPHYDCYYEARGDGIYFSGHYPLPPGNLTKWIDWPQ